MCVSVREVTGGCGHNQYKTVTTLRSNDIASSLSLLTHYLSLPPFLRFSLSSSLSIFHSLPSRSLLPSLSPLSALLPLSLPDAVMWDNNINLLAPNPSYQLSKSYLMLIMFYVREKFCSEGNIRRVYYLPYNIAIIRNTLGN